MGDPELGGEFLRDSVLPPLGMVAGDPADEGSVLAGNAGTSNASTPGSAASHEPDPLPVPGDDGLGSDDDQGSLPPGPQAPKQDPEAAITGAEPRMSVIPLVDRELLV
jgi:hypothetical protein